MVQAGTVEDTSEHRVTLQLDRRHTPRIERAAVIGIVLLALGLRVWGVGFGLPYLYHPDEPRYVDSAQVLFKTLDLDPHSLPNIASSSFVYVINAAAYVPYYLIGRLTGSFKAPTDIPAPTMLAMGVGYISRPSVMVWGRLVTVLTSVLSVWLLYVIGRRLFNQAMIGGLAALLLAISPASVTLSRYITPDTFVMFFTLALFWAAVSIEQQPRMRVYVIAGAALGCLLSSKVSGALGVLPLLIVQVHRRGLKGLLNHDMWVLGITTCAACLVTTPYLLGDAPKVIDDILFEGRHYLTGHAGMEGDSLSWYLNYLWLTTGGLAVVAGLAALRGVMTRSKEIGLLTVFPLVSLIFISSFVVRNDRTALPLIPFVVLLAAWGVAQAWTWAIRLTTPARRRLATAGLAGILLVGVGWPLAQTINATHQLTTEDSRETARRWIDEHLPAGAHIAVESYAPFVDPARFVVQGFQSMIDHPPAWYVEQGFNYLVFSQGMFKRYYHEPDKYPLEVSQYDSFFQHLTLVKLFDDGGYEVRIYHID